VIIGAEKVPPDAARLETHKPSVFLIFL